MLCQLPLIRSGGLRVPVYSPQLPCILLLAWCLLLLHMEMSLHQRSMHIMKDGLEPFHLVGIARCASRGFIPGFGEHCQLAALIDARSYPPGKM
jgi:hypothetical protein